MAINKDNLTLPIIRFLCISGLITAMAFLIYQKNVFIPTRWPFQFFSSGITIGLAYTAFRKNHVVIGLIALLCWGSFRLWDNPKFKDWHWTRLPVWNRYFILGLYN